MGEEREKEMRRKEGRRWGRRGGLGGKEEDGVEEEDKVWEEKD